MLKSFQVSYNLNRKAKQNQNIDLLCPILGRVEQKNNWANSRIDFQLAQFADIINIL